MNEKLPIVRNANARRDYFINDLLGLSMSTMKYFMCSINQKN